MTFLMLILSDLYRLVAGLLDWRGHLRRLRGQGRYDVACIANFMSPRQLGFMGLAAWRRDVASGLRFSLNGRLGRFLLIRSSAQDLETAAGREVAKGQLRAAIAKASRDGARVVLFGAGTKRIFNDLEIEGLRRTYPHLTFTIGDHGTGWALLQDVYESIAKAGLHRDSRILIIGYNGFLGGIVRRTLAAEGYRRVALASHRQASPFSGLRDVQLVVACSHHRSVRLTAATLERIGHPEGVHVIDVCKPTNLNRRELAVCAGSVSRQDAGNTFNAQLDWVFSPGARIVLGQLKLAPTRLWGCFSEALAIASLDDEVLGRHDFMDINPAATALVNGLMPRLGFSASPPCNYGRLEATESVEESEVLFDELAAGSFLRQTPGALF